MLIADDDRISIDIADAGALEMDTAPTNDASTGTGATSIVSLFQTNCVAVRVIREISWLVARDGAVAIMSVYPSRGGPQDD